MEKTFPFVPESSFALQRQLYDDHLPAEWSAHTQSEADGTLYIISVRPDPGALEGVGSSVRLSEGLYVCRTRRNRSRLYHDVKATAHPDQLLVAPLLDLPKFKGMARGVAQKLRRLKN